MLTWTEVTAEPSWNRVSFFGAAACTILVTVCWSDGLIEVTSVYPPRLNAARRSCGVVPSDSSSLTLRSA